MGFVKTGDEMPIAETYDENLEAAVCPKCGRKLVAISIDGSENSLICEECDLEEWDA